MRKRARHLASPCEGLRRSVQGRATSRRIAPECAGEAQECAGVLRSVRESLYKNTTTRHAAQCEGARGKKQQCARMCVMRASAQARAPKVRGRAPERGGECGDERECAEVRNSAHEYTRAQQCAGLRSVKDYARSSTATQECTRCARSRRRACTGVLQRAPKRGGARGRVHACARTHRGVPDCAGVRRECAGVCSNAHRCAGLCANAKSRACAGIRINLRGRASVWDHFGLGRKAQELARRSLPDYATRHCRRARRDTRRRARSKQECRNTRK